MDWMGENIEGWFLSEKLDGCRAYWDGECFWTRSGKRVNAPEWFTSGLPKCHLDGEIYAGIGKLGIASSAVKHGNFGSEDQPTVKFFVFDFPTASGNWAERMESSFLSFKHAEKVKHQKCQGIEHLTQLLHSIKSVGGEGIVARNHRPQKYQTGRVSSFLKIKHL